MTKDQKLKKAAQELQDFGRNGDKILAHINPEEAQILKDLGGSGTVNPDTGLLEFFYDYGWSAPSYSWQAPVYTYTPPVYEYVAPVYTPPVYEYVAPVYTPPTSSWQGTTGSNAGAFGGITNTPEYQAIAPSDPITNYVNTPVNMGDPYNLISKGPDYNANLDANLGAIDYLYKDLGYTGELSGAPTTTQVNTYENWAYSPENPPALDMVDSIVESVFKYPEATNQPGKATNGMTLQQLKTLQAAGFGSEDISDTQTVDQAIGALTLSRMSPSQALGLIGGIVSGNPYAVASSIASISGEKTLASTIGIAANIASGNLPAAVAGLAGLSGQKDVANAIGFANALRNGDVNTMAQIAAAVSGNKDLQSTVSAVNAVASKNPIAITSALINAQPTLSKLASGDLLNLVGASAIKENDPTDVLLKSYQYSEENPDKKLGIPAQKAVSDFITSGAVEVPGMQGLLDILNKYDGTQYAQALPISISDAGGGTTALQRLGSGFAANDPRFLDIASKAPNLRAAIDEYTNIYGAGSGGDASYMSELQTAMQDPDLSEEDRALFKSEINKLLVKNPALSQYVNQEPIALDPWETDLGEVIITGKKMTPEERAKFDKLTAKEKEEFFYAQMPDFLSGNLPSQKNQPNDQKFLEDIIAASAAAPTSPAAPSVAPPVTPQVTPPNANVTPAQVEKIVSDALKVNPSLTSGDVQKIVFDAIKTVPNLTADQVKTIVSAEVSKLPVGASPADVQMALDASAASQSAATKQAIDDAINAAQKATIGQITDLGAKTAAQYNALTAAQKAEADARVAQGQSLQDAVTGVSGQVAGLEVKLTAQGKAFADQLVQQGMDYKTAMQTAIDAQSALFGNKIGNVQAEIAANEARRIADQQAAAEEARKAEIRSGIRTTAAQGQQQLQNIQQQLPQVLQAAQQVSTPIYGQMGPYLDIGSELDFGFFKPSPEKQAGTKQQQPTKIAAGGYIDDLLAGDMTADDLLNLLR